MNSEGDEAKLVSSADQYEELCGHIRHNDTRLWLIPTTAYSISILGFAGASKTTDPLIAGLLALVALLVFAAFSVQFARYLAYLEKNEIELKALEKNSPHVDPVTHLSGLRSLPNAKRWFIRKGAENSSGSWMFYTMLVTLVVFVVMTFFLIKERLPEQEQADSLQEVSVKHVIEQKDQ